MFVVLVTGSPGSGKSATLAALLDALAENEIPHAGVDVDEVTWAYPFPDLSQRCEHLRAWRDSHARAGATLLIVAEVIESSEHLTEVLEALGADEHLLVRLHADPATLRARIIEREPDGWFGLGYLLDETERLESVLHALEDVDLDFDTTRSSVVRIAEAIRCARPDELMPATPGESALGTTGGGGESSHPAQAAIRSTST